MQHLDLFLKGRLRQAIAPAERDALEAAIDSVVVIDARKCLINRAEKVDRSYYLIEGSMLRTIDDSSGYRQIVGVQVPGDFVDLHSFPMKRLDHDVLALANSRLAVFRHERLRELIAQFPHLARIMWFSTLLDAAMHREWIFRLGRLRADGRVAHLICELIERLRMVGCYHKTEFILPLTQQDFSEACGINVIHANRTFRALREDGLIEKIDGSRTFRVLDEAGLRRLGEFRPDYLYGDGALHLDEAYHDA